MRSDRTIYLITTPDGQTLHAEWKWSVSRGRDTYGYNICTLYIDGRKVSACNGGGYDMEGTCLGHWFAAHAKTRLLTLTKEFYDLSFHDPDYDPGKAIPVQVPAGESDEGKTVEELETEGKSLGLERYQAFYLASSKTPDAKRRIPLIDGAVGISFVQAIGQACGYSFRRIANPSAGTRSSPSALFIHLHKALQDRLEGLKA